MDVRTPTIDRYLNKNILEVGKRRREFAKKYRQWRQAYQAGETPKAMFLAKERDNRALKLTKAQHEADKFLYGISTLWKVDHLRE